MGFRRLRITVNVHTVKCLPKRLARSGRADDRDAVACHGQCSGFPANAKVPRVRLVLQEHQYPISGRGFHEWSFAGLCVSATISSSLQCENTRLPFRTPVGIDENAVPQFDAEQAPEQRAVVGKTSLVIAEQFLDKEGVEKPSSMQCGGRKSVPEK